MNRSSESIFSEHVEAVYQLTPAFLETEELNDQPCSAVQLLALVDLLLTGSGEFELSIIIACSGQVYRVGHTHIRLPFHNGFV